MPISDLEINFRISKLPLSLEGKGEQDDAHL